MYCFYGKPNTDWTKYGLGEDTESWKYWNGVWRIRIDKKTNAIRFNMITSDVLKIFRDMVLDDVIIVSTYKKKDYHYHYVGLSDEEYELIQNRRNNLDLKIKDKV